MSIECKLTDCTENDRKKCKHEECLFFTAGKVLVTSPEVIHKLAVEKGWWDTKREVPELLCLVHSEVSEALEAYRNNVPSSSRNCLAEELADIVIRVFDMATFFKIDIIGAIARKHQYNKTRAYKHGGKKC